jgi:inositol phosphorylceramide synthase catalytic subunit
MTDGPGRMGEMKWLVWAVWVMALIGYHVLNPLRAEHMGMLLGVVLAWYAARISRQFVLVFLPLILYGWCYDLLRIFAERAVRIVTIGPVREAELALFGWWRGEERVGPVEVFLEHHHPLLDLLGAPIYASHVGTIILFAALLWWRTRTGEPKRDHGRLHRFLWGFLWLNLIGFAVQVLYPVAPPWYVELYGYAMPVETIGGHPAGLGRVDELIGIDYFQGVYAQAAYVFGAMPSLHVAYPVWLLLHVRGGLWRGLVAVYAVLMAFFAVYFIHHYVVDLVAGAVLSIGMYVILARTRAGKVPVRIHETLSRWFLADDQEEFFWERMRK